MKKDETSGVNLKAIDRNIKTMQRIRTQSAEGRSWDQKLADDVTGFLGTTRTLYIHLLFYGSFLAMAIFLVNKNSITWPEAVSLMGTIATLETLFLTIFVLINQHRMKSLEKRDSDLHLQMSLLGEHEITRLIQMTDSIVKHFNIASELPAQDLKELKKEIRPDQIIEKMDHHESIATEEAKNKK